MDANSIIDRLFKEAPLTVALDPTRAQARKLVYYGKLIAAIFSLLGFLSLLSSLFSFRGFFLGGRGLGSLVFGFIVAYMVDEQVTWFIDQNNIQQARSNMVIWIILGLLAGIIPGLFILLSYLELDKLSTPAAPAQPVGASYPAPGPVPPGNSVPQPPPGADIPPGDDGEVGDLIPIAPMVGSSSDDTIPKAVAVEEDDKPSSQQKASNVSVGGIGDAPPQQHKVTEGTVAEGSNPEQPVPSPTDPQPVSQPVQPGAVPVDPQPISRPAQPGALPADPQPVSQQVKDTADGE